MKATPETLSEDYHAAGLWDHKTLDGLFRETADRAPDRLAISDAPNRESWTGGNPRQLTYAEAENEINRLAAFFRMVGLSADHVIGLQAPNTVDTVIAFLAALRADLVVSPLPLHWRQKNVLRALNSIGAKGFIAADRVETRQVGTAARDVAADLFSLRFVFGLGSDIPDGLIDLGPMLKEMGDDLEFSGSERTDNADHIATICWSRSGQDNIPVTRNHNHWLTAGRETLNATSLADGAALLVPYSLSGLTGLGAGLVPWIACGGSLHLHHPTSLAGLADHANDIGADCVLAPGPLAHTLDRKLSHRKTKILAAWNIAAPRATKFVAKHPIVDLQIADEFGLVAKARGPSAKAGAIPLGKADGSNGCESGPAPLEISVSAQNDLLPDAPRTLLVKGAMVPETGWHSLGGERNLPVNSDGFLETGIVVEVEGDSLNGFGIPGQTAPGSGDLEAIDEIYASFPGVREAAAFVVEDEVLGGRLQVALVPNAGTVPDARAFFAFLDAEGVDLAKIPNRVLVLTAIPRRDDGSVDRQRLTLRTQRLPAVVA